MKAVSVPRVMRSGFRTTCHPPTYHATSEPVPMRNHMTGKKVFHNCSALSPVWNNS